MKPFASILLFLLLAACSCRTLVGLKPVYFSADSSVFADTFSRAHWVIYPGVKGLAYPCAEIVELLPGQEVTAFVAGPTFFMRDGREFLVYPGEHILVTEKNYVPTFATASQNKLRDRELLVLKTFFEREKKPGYPFLPNCGYLTLLGMEQELKEQVAGAESASQRLLDSLCTAYQVSPKFKKLTRDYARNRYDLSVLDLYLTYRDTLLAHGAYRYKLKALLPEVNQVKKVSQFNRNVQNNANELHDWLYDSGMRNRAEQGGFQASFDTVAATFKGPVRDYLLSRLLYRASNAGVDISARYRRRYRRYSYNRDYRKIIAGSIRQQRSLAKNSPVLPNELLAADGKTKKSLEEVISRHKGKYVLVDLWASWCLPCIEAMPALQELKKRYPSEKIAFLGLSVDKYAAPWQRRLSDLRADSSTSYLLVNHHNAALARQIGLTAIPRYLLYDREGKIIHADAPGPGDPELQQLLDKLLL
ncbi:TlpA disulfide reductase family protein [Paraflavisolibacter sp. H34]|uniref:TlpA family protein disulfide reductase n=1 Tax=Huijunlia imazamoxiresistens TaxID=3127457 RepID=UPI0030194F76